MPLKHFQTIRYWDPAIDAEAVRISGFDGRGGEFWMTQPLVPAGQSRRAQQDKCHEFIAEAIALADQGLLQPGQVIVE